jgi:hypothetical protein
LVDNLRISQLYDLDTATYRSKKLLHNTTPGASGTLSVPDPGKPYFLVVTGCGGGGGGSGASYYAALSTGAGGYSGAAGAGVSKLIIPVTGALSLPWTIGSGGAAGVQGNNVTGVTPAAPAGTDTTLGDLLVLQGGRGGTSNVPGDLGFGIKLYIFEQFRPYGGVVTFPTISPEMIVTVTNQQECIFDGRWYGRAGCGYGDTGPTALVPPQTSNLNFGYIGPGNGTSLSNGPGGAGSLWGRGGDVLSTSVSNATGFGAGGAGGQKHGSNSITGGSAGSGGFLTVYSLLSNNFAMNIYN